MRIYKIIKYGLTRFLCPLFLCASNLHAQAPEVFSTLDTSVIRIGEQTKIKLSILIPSNSSQAKISWPIIGDTLRKEIDVVAVSDVDTSRSNGKSILTETITITSFDSGYWAIPPFIFIIKGDSARPLFSQALLLEVRTMPVDTSEASIKDIKGILNEESNWRDYLPYFYYGLALLMAILVIIYLTLKYAKKKPVLLPPDAPKRPPHEIALEALELIKTRKLWQDGKFKEYHTLIADTLRTYLEGRYKITAMELTSAEILSVMRHQVVDKDSMENLRQVLILADFVKFAKGIPIEAENELAMHNALYFINGTLRPLENEEKNEEDETRLK